MKLKYRGKNAIVTGACGGMGLDVTKKLLENKIRTLMIDIKDPPINFIKKNNYAIFKKINLTKLIFLLIGLIGTVIILSPSKSSFNEYAIIVLAAAISYAIAHNFTKTLTKTDSIISILFWMSLIQLPLSIFCGIFYGGFKLLYFSELPLIFIFSATSLLAHLCLAKSLKLADASFVLPLDYIRLPIITAIGWYMYSENISLNIIIGSLFIIISSIISLKRN